MIFKSLVEYYERLAAQGKVPAFGLTQEKIGYCVLLDRDGKLQDIVSLSNPSDKKSKWTMLTVPASFKRPGIAPLPFFLWDKTAFVLGVEHKKDSDVPTLNARSHRVFKALHLERLADATDEGLVALRKFIEEWIPDQWQQCEPVVKHGSAIFGANIVFRLDGEHEYIHERAAAQELIKRYSAIDDSPLGQCLVSGETRPIARLHPAIKGVWGAQSAGASLVSFNLDAFDSYGKDRGANAPISVHAAFAYTTVLNYLLLRDPHHRQCVQIGDASVVFWAEAKNQEQQKAAEDFFSDAFEPPYSDPVAIAKLKSALDAVSEGRALSDLNALLDPSSRIFVLGLSPNASRLSVRFWFTERLDVFTKRLADHYNDLLVEPTPWKTPPNQWRLMSSIAAQDKTENISSWLAGSLARSILSGQGYPHALSSSVITRIRSDGRVTGMRVAICKAALSRNHRLNPKDNPTEVPVSFDPEKREPGYLFGRLFAVLENIQEVALGEVNSSIKDRYYASASAVPQRVFPLLLKGVVHHISRGRKGKKRNLILSLERRMREIVLLINSNFPRSLSVEQQSWFALGYYHQYQECFSSSTKKAEAEDITDEDTENMQ
jgi:CRISPR-associated protein Csd1